MNTPQFRRECIHTLLGIPTAYHSYDRVTQFMHITNVPLLHGGKSRLSIGQINFLTDETTTENLSSYVNSGFVGFPIGPDLLSYLHDSAQLCDKQTQPFITSVWNECYQSYLKMLKIWMSDGVICDPFKELFIVSDIRDSSLDPLGRKERKKQRKKEQKARKRARLERFMERDEQSDHEVQEEEVTSDPIDSLFKIHIDQSKIPAFLLNLDTSHTVPTDSVIHRIVRSGEWIRLRKEYETKNQKIVKWDPALFTSGRKTSERPTGYYSQSLPMDYVPPEIHEDEMHPFWRMKKREKEWNERHKAKDDKRPTTQTTEPSKLTLSSEDPIDEAPTMLVDEPPPVTTIVETIKPDLLQIVPVDEQELDKSEVLLDVDTFWKNELAQFNKLSFEKVERAKQSRQQVEEEIQSDKKREEEIQSNLKKERETYRSDLQQQIREKNAQLEKLKEIERTNSEQNQAYSTQQQQIIALQEMLAKGDVNSQTLAELRKNISETAGMTQVRTMLDIFAAQFSELERKDRMLKWQRRRRGWTENESDGPNQLLYERMQVKSRRDEQIKRIRGVFLEGDDELHDEWAFWLTEEDWKEKVEQMKIAMGRMAPRPETMLKDETEEQKNDETDVNSVASEVSSVVLSPDISSHTPFSRLHHPPEVDSPLLQSTSRFIPVQPEGDSLMMRDDDPFVEDQHPNQETVESDTPIERESTPQSITLEKDPAELFVTFDAPPLDANEPVSLQNPFLKDDSTKPMSRGAWECVCGGMEERVKTATIISPIADLLSKRSYSILSRQALSLFIRQHSLLETFHTITTHLLGLDGTFLSSFAEMWVTKMYASGISDILLSSRPEDGAGREGEQVVHVMEMDRISVILRRLFELEMGVGSIREQEKEELQIDQSLPNVVLRNLLEDTLKEQEEESTRFKTDWLRMVCVLDTRLSISLWLAIPDNHPLTIFFSQSSIEVYTAINHLLFTLSRLSSLLTSPALQNQRSLFNSRLRRDRSPMFLYLTRFKIVQFVNTCMAAVGMAVSTVLDVFKRAMLKSSNLDELIIAHQRLLSQLSHLLASALLPHFHSLFKIIFKTVRFFDDAANQPETAFAASQAFQKCTEQWDAHYRKLLATVEQMEEQTIDLGVDTKQLAENSIVHHLYTQLGND
ncbi:hypothetical protein BLNAU_9480 [Blattamonas nauphoetae]|uniref:Gamma tubulin complex component protein N-terminal domain-containing protein n=1 Tax=Blattamonas nauphoetae TaxID=2049346 RepID=A0ABQ9XVX9_9EUKA|nr:hypothetical protein BLNAU_9480 [Blattamonas nauphoetae]